MLHLEYLIIGFEDRGVIFMGKFRGLRKKLLAGLCAFTSCVGGASAVGKTKLSGNIDITMLSHSMRPNAGIQLSSDEKKARDVLDTIIGSDRQGKLLDWSKNAELSGVARDFCIEFSTMKGYLNFRFFVEAWRNASVSDTEEGNNGLAFEFFIETAYVAKRLLASGYKVEGNGFRMPSGTLIDSTDSLITSGGVDLFKILFKDVMGIDAPMYPAQTATYNSNNPISDSNHPGTNGCWINCIKNFLIPRTDGVTWENRASITEDGTGNPNQLITSFTKEKAGEKGINFVDDQIAIWKKFFGENSNFKNSDYYKTVKRGPYPSGKSAGYKAAIVFDAFFGLGATGAGLWGWYEYYKGQVAQEAHEAERKEWARSKKLLKGEADNYRMLKSVAKSKGSRSVLSLINDVENRGNKQAGRKGSSPGRRRSRSR